MRHAWMVMLAVLVVVSAGGCCLMGDGPCGCGGVGLGRGKLVKSKDASAANPMPKASGAITADGKLDEGAWNRAVALTSFIHGSNPPAVKTRVLVTYDAANLYVAVACEEPDTDKLETDVTERDGEVWTDDCVEIYIDPSNEKQGTTGYYGFFVTPTNVVYDRTEDGNWSSTDWKSGARVVAGKGWVAETVLPFKMMGVQPKAGHKLGVMAARLRKAGVSEYMTLVPCDNEAKDTTKYPVLELK